MPIPRFLYFDLGNVLFHFDHSLICRQVAKVAELPVGDVEAFFAAEHPIDLEMGRTTPKDVYDVFCQAFSISPGMEKVLYAASDIFSINTPIIPLISRLAMSNQRMGILSNTNAPHWEFLVAQDYAILPDLFEATILSYEVRSMKPDSKIFEVAAERAAVPSAEIFFTDDRVENVEAAVAAGWQAVLFQGAHPLEEELRKRGVEFN